MSTSAALLAHLSGPVLTVATLVTITRQDGTVLAFTDHDQPISYNGISYTASRYSPSAIASTADMAVDNLEIQAVVGIDTATESDLLAGLWRGARVRIEQINWADLSMGARILRTGFLGEVTFGRLGLQAELRGLAQLLQKNVGELTSVLCRADLGDTRCGINLAALAVTGSITAVQADNRSLTDTSRTEPGPASPVTITAISTAEFAVVTAAGHGKVKGETVSIADVLGMLSVEYVDGQTYTGTASINGSFATVRSVTSANQIVLNLDTRPYSAYTSGGKLYSPGSVGTFDGGLLTWTSGANTGRAMEVKSYVPGLIVLAQAMPYPVAVGDTYSMTPGCGKRLLEDCVARYGNAVNFVGEPHLPGMEKLLQVGGQ